MLTKNKIDQLELLMSKYTKLIEDDQHKPQDGSIEIDYNVYNDYWSLSHPGHINKWEVIGKTLTKALDKAITEIELMIRVEEQLEKEGKESENANTNSS